MKEIRCRCGNILEIKTNKECMQEIEENIYFINFDEFKDIYNDYKSKNENDLDFNFIEKEYPYICDECGDDVWYESEIK